MSNAYSTHQYNFPSRPWPRKLVVVVLAARMGSLARFQLQ